MKQEVKKLLILNLPYLLFVYLFDKIGAAIRLAPGADASEKLLQLGTGFAAAFSSIAPSLHPIDLLIGIAGAVIIRLAVYMKGKNAKKYRKGMEYGSARWGGAEDIKPYKNVPEFLQEQKQLTPDELETGETIKTPRGTFYVTDMSREQMEAAGYGFHHQSDDGKYLVMGNGTRAFAIAAEQRENSLKAAEQTTEQNENMIDGIINNTPTVDELEAKVKAGETISLVDLANAVKADKERGKGKPEKKSSIRAQLKADKEKAQKKAAAKTKNHDLEV